jgi:hypothetical protein
MADEKNAGTKQLERMARQWFLDKSIKQGLANMPDAEDQSRMAKIIEREINTLWQDASTREQIMSMHAKGKPKEEKTSLEELRMKYGVVIARA